MPSGSISDSISATVKEPVALVYIHALILSILVSLLGNTLDSVDQEVQTLCAKLKKNSPTALGLSKLALNKAWDANLSTGLDYEVEVGAITIAAGELPQGYKAFISGEEPEFDVQKRLTTDDGWKVLS